MAFCSCFNTQPPEGGWKAKNAPLQFFTVSTHSRLKAAGHDSTAPPFPARRFNTQPPEGGWKNLRQLWQVLRVSTHSRLKAAGIYLKAMLSPIFCFNTQPPEGGWVYAFVAVGFKLSFNTQPPEGGWFGLLPLTLSLFTFQHTAA